MDDFFEATRRKFRHALGRRGRRSVGFSRCRAGVHLCSSKLNCVSTPLLSEDHTVLLPQQSF